jgi:hypothetical protein
MNEAGGGRREGTMSGRESEREGFLGRLEERLSRVSGRLAEGRHGAKDLRGRTEAIRGELERLRSAVGAIAREDLARVRATMDDLRSDYDVPPPHFALRREELEVFRRHLATVSRLMPVLSNLDDPRWEAAYEEYDRSWAEVQRASEPEGDAAAP